MTHTAVIVSSRQKGNAILAFTGRCCGDPATDKPYTLYVSASMTDEEIEREIQTHLRSTEALHAATQRAAAVLAKYQGGK